MIKNNYDKKNKKHIIRKIEKTINLKYIANSFNTLKKDKVREGYSIEVAIKSLFLQFYYDMSDREAEDKGIMKNVFTFIRVK